MLRFDRTTSILLYVRYFHYAILLCYLLVNDAAAQPTSTSISTFVPVPLLPDIEFNGVKFKRVGRGYALLAAKWVWAPLEKKLIDVCWENDSADKKIYRDFVQSTIEDSWEKYSSVRFVGWKKCGSNPAGIRVGDRDAPPRTRGLGKKLKGKQNGILLNFAFASWGTSCSSSESARLKCIKSIAVHEFGHALALGHEHNRPDTPGECLAEAGEDETGDTMLTPWDPFSVMNYCNSKFNGDGVLSDGDKLTVQALY